MAPDNSNVPDRRRIASLLGLVVSRLGPNAHNVVSGTLLTLFIASRTGSAFLITFGTTAHNLLGWFTIPLVGRLSDGKARRLGRRVPVMTAALLVMAIGTFAYSVTNGYWLLVALIVLVRTAAINLGVTGAVALPEVFGRHVWARAAVVIGLLGGVVSLGLRGTVIGTWEADDPSTWTSTFRIAAVIIAVAAIAMAALVREADVALAHDATTTPRDLQLTDAPNRGVVLSALMLSVAAGGATGYIFPVYATDQLAASPGDLAFYPLWSGALAVVVAVAAGLWVNAHVTRRTVAVGAPLVLTAVALAHVFATNLVQAAVFAALAAGAGAALLVSLTPLLLQLLPSHGGFAERVGRAYGPLVAVGVASAYVSGVAADAVDDLRVVWLFPAAIGIVQAIVSSRVSIPEGQEHTDLSALIRRAVEANRRAAGRDRSRSLVRGELTERDVDTLELFDALRISTDPYTGEVVTPPEHRRRGRRCAWVALRPIVRSLRTRRIDGPGFRRAAERLGGGHALVAERIAARPDVYGPALAAEFSGATFDPEVVDTAEHDAADYDVIGDIERIERWVAALWPDSDAAADLAELRVAASVRRP